MKRPIITDAVCPLREKYEVINILVTEQQLMEYVRRNDTSPATRSCWHPFPTIERT